MLSIHRQKKSLDSLFAAARELPDPELQSHWSRYLCILVNGFLENSVEACLQEFSDRRSHQFVSNFVSAELRDFQNPRMGKILNLFGSFNPEWKSKLEEATKGQLADSINSIVGNRHRIAHGEDVSLSMGSLTAYYKDAVTVVTLLQDICGTASSPEERSA